MKLEVHPNPIALIFQIHNGKLVEPVLSTELVFAGGVTKHDIWLKDMPDEWKTRAQTMIDEALKILEENEEDHSH